MMGWLTRRSSEAFLKCCKMILMKSCEVLEDGLQLYWQHMW